MRPRLARLEAAAAASGIGARGVLALDWWNGNRSVLMNADLSGPARRHDALDHAR